MQNATFISKVKFKEFYSLKFWHCAAVIECFLFRQDTPTVFTLSQRIYRYHTDYRGNITFVKGPTIH